MFCLVNIMGMLFKISFLTLFLQYNTITVFHTFRLFKKMQFDPISISELLSASCGILPIANQTISYKGYFLKFT